MKESTLTLGASARRLRTELVTETNMTTTMINTTHLQEKPSTPHVTTPRESCSTGSFVTKLYKMVDSEPATIVSWIRGGTAFCIVDPKMMAEHCLPKYFRHRRLSSLIRQLNFYSFYRVQEGQLTIYQHSYFRKGRPDLLVHIKRRGAGKAKDPWFDPLAATIKPPLQIGIHGISPNLSSSSSATETTLSTTNPVICYSPMAKPVTAVVDNMSPALKPGVASLCPPLVDLGNTFIENETKKMKKMVEIANQMNTNVGKLAVDVCMARPETPVATKVAGNDTESTEPASQEIDVQDFLTEECAIDAEESKSEDYSSGSSPSMIAKCAQVARDCMKWDQEEDEDHDVSHRSNQETIASSSLSTTHPQPIAHNFADDLLDLSQVEPGAWEVPLSPLNEEEDVIPWLDLCF